MSGRHIEPGDGAVEVTRSEERALATTVRRAVERVLLEKTIVEEEQVITVRLRREQVRIVHEPIDSGHVGPADPSSAHSTPWVTVREERAEVTTVLVPVERVRLAVDSVRAVEQAEVALRREQVDIVQDPTV